MVDGKVIITKERDLTEDKNRSIIKYMLCNMCFKCLNGMDAKVVRRRYIGC